MNSYIRYVTINLCRKKFFFDYAFSVSCCNMDRKLMRITHCFQFQMTACVVEEDKENKTKVYSTPENFRGDWLLFHHSITLALFCFCLLIKSWSQISSYSHFITLPSTNRVIMQMYVLLDSTTAMLYIHLLWCNRRMLPETMDCWDINSSEIPLSA